jgi:hypothetical protein
VKIRLSEWLAPDAAKRACPYRGRWCAVGGPAAGNHSERGDAMMNLELSDEEREIVRRALDNYISNLREEIVKAEKHEWKAGLRNEQEVLKRVVSRLS